MRATPLQFHTSRMGRIVLLAMEEILGQNGLNAVLSLVHIQDSSSQVPVYDQEMKFPAEQISRLQIALESAYGPRAGRGVAQRVGRACLKYGLREFGSELGVIDSSYRLMPIAKRLERGCEVLAGLINRLTDQHVHYEVDKKHIFWHIERFPLCLVNLDDGPRNSFLIGLLQEALSWVSGGKYFLVEEKKPVASIDRLCTISIDQTPLS